MASVVVYLVSGWIHIALQIAMLLFHYSRLRFVDGSKKGRSTAKICKIITIVRVSYLIFVAYTIRLAIPTLMVSINMIYPYLNQSICYFIKRAELCTVIFGRTLVHLFIAMRSRFGTRSVNNRWYKFGLSFLFLDVLVFLYMSSPFLDIKTAHEYGQCVTITITPIVLLWLAFNDLFIGIYSLFAFILPLRRLVLNNNKENVQDISDLIKRIVIYSIIALFITLISILVSMSVPGLGQFLSPLSSTVTIYCIIMQFSNIPLKKLKSKYLRLIVSIFQLSCMDYSTLKRGDDMVMMTSIHKNATKNSDGNDKSDGNKETCSVGRKSELECKTSAETEVAISVFGAESAGSDTPTLPKVMEMKLGVPSATNSETV